MLTHVHPHFRAAALADCQRTPEGCLVHVSGRRYVYLGRRWRKKTRRMIYLHRAFYPEPLTRNDCLVRTCSNPACVSPAHYQLYSRRAQMGQARRQRVCKGRRPKLSWVDVEMIRHLRIHGHTLHSLAKRFGVSVSLINAVVRNRRHVNRNYTPPPLRWTREDPFGRSRRSTLPYSI